MSSNTVKFKGYSIQYPQNNILMYSVFRVVKIDSIYPVIHTFQGAGFIILYPILQYTTHFLPEYNNWLSKASYTGKYGERIKGGVSLRIIFKFDNHLFAYFFTQV